MKSIKFVIPFAAVACFTLASCNKGADVPSGLARVTYANKPAKLAELAPTIFAFKDKQVKTNATTGLTDWEFPSKGTVTTNFGFNASGSINITSIGVDGKPVTIELNNINLGTDDSITTMWDLAEEHEYFGVQNKRGESVFIKHAIVDETKKTKEWRRYVPKEYDGVKYCTNLEAPDPWGRHGPVSPEAFGNIGNYLMLEIEQNNGFFNRKSAIYQGLGFGLSGFTPTKVEKAQVVNYLAPGKLTDKEFTLVDPLDQKQKPAYDILDSYTQDEIIRKLVPFVTEYTEKEDKSAATMNIGIKDFDFTTCEDVLKLIAKIKPEILDMVNVSGSGIGSIDYFVGYKDNWIYQHELKFDANNVNLQVYFHAGNLVLVDIKNLNVHGCFNMTFEKDKFENYQEPNLAGYTLLNPEVK